MTQVFADRVEAGRLLAQKLLDSGEVTADALVLALPRGGVPVGFELAAALGAPLDVLVVRKLGCPGQPELAMGAIASGGIRVLNDELIALIGIDPEMIESITRSEQPELARREQRYRGDRSAPEIAGRCVVLVDDGVATGATIKAAIAGLRQRQPGKIVVAIPTAPPDVCAELETLADALVCVTQPEPYIAVGRWYADFSQVSDEEVRALLDRASAARNAGH